MNKKNQAVNVFLFSTSVYFLMMFDLTIPFSANYLDIL